MTTPERGIEEIVEEFNSTFPGCDQCQYGNGQGDWIEHWLTQTLQTERQRCEEMVERIVRVEEAIEEEVLYWKGVQGHEAGLIASKNIKQALTNPNNPK